MGADRRLAREQEEEAPIAAPQQLDAAPAALQEETQAIAGTQRLDAPARVVLGVLAAAGLMQPLEPRPLVQRALDSVMREASRIG